MTTKIITPQEVTPEILRAGVESNETPHSHPSRFQMVDDSSYVNYSVFSDGEWWECETIFYEDVQKWMEADTYDETIWLTPINWSAS